jgi:1,2-diacylglycerol 3-beta-galactosyltransferase
MFGGFGSNAMRHIAQRLPDMPLILLCGRNTSLAQALRKQPSRAPRVIVEFTEQVPDWLRLGDFFIGKPGPASVSEAIHLGLPVIVTRNAWTMPQERYNTDWILENGLGIVHRSFRTIHQATSELVADLQTFRARVSNMKNQAIEEVPALVMGLLEQHAGQSSK